MPAVFGRIHTRLPQTRYLGEFEQLSCCSRYISPYDQLSIGIAVLILTGCALMAAVVPARRASKANPATLLRHI